MRRSKEGLVWICLLLAAALGWRLQSLPHPGGGRLVAPRPAQAPAPASRPFTGAQRDYDPSLLPDRPAEPPAPVAPPVPAPPVTPSPAPPPATPAPEPPEQAPAPGSPPASRPEPAPGLSVPWQTLPAAPAAPVPDLGQHVSRMTDPVAPAHQVVCKAGSAGPVLQVTRDGGLRWQTIPLASSPAFRQPGAAACGTVALDPHDPRAYYLSASGVDAPPFMTPDLGKSWRAVPPPSGFQPPSAFFLGFDVNTAGVTAWFTSASPDRPLTAEAVAGSQTVDGGQTWQTIGLRCPSASPCAWQLRSPDGSSPHLALSTDGGRSWQWAAWDGAALTIRHAYGLGPSVLEVTRTGDSAPLLRSQDGGRTWTRVDLPLPPDGWQAPLLSGFDLTVQADGSLLLQQFRRTGGNRWFRLMRGSDAWEPALAPSLPDPRPIRAL